METHQKKKKKNYPSPLFQNSFDIIFSPQIMEFILEYYLPAQQYAFLFHPSHIDIVLLSTQLQIFLSDTTEPLLTTLYLYSYFTFICSKPSNPEILPLHTFCVHNPLLTFNYFFQFKRFENTRECMKFIKI
jgi:hypothetical protein